ncbi:VOC family protein [Streptomyces sp. NPDC052052]|uniref:VOC family protein n=1 Tax=Streptomyces sp. NPDC052052 TaxID=3154756 RepID=UPI00343769AF
MIKGLDRLEVITLFVEDVIEAKRFYQDVFGLEVVYENEDSAVVKLNNTMINLLVTENAPTLVEPRPVAAPDAGARLLFTIEVEDADAVCAELVEHGVALLNGPTDRPWGRRTAAFADPSGNVWEIAQLISGEASDQPHSTVVR